MARAGALRVVADAADFAAVARTRGDERHAAAFHGTRAVLHGAGGTAGAGAADRVARAERGSGNRRAQRLSQATGDILLLVRAGTARSRISSLASAAVPVSRRRRMRASRRRIHAR